jgi:trigger factor
VKVTTERTANCQAIVTVEVDEEQITDTMKRAAQKISRIRPIPGFRPGKAPYERVERAVGKELLRDEAIDELAQSLYKQVLKDENIEPYDAGKLDISQKEPLILKFTVPTRPVVTLGDYHSIHLQPEPVQVLDDEVDRVLEQLRREQTALTPVTRAVQLDDHVTVDLQGGIEGQTPMDRQGLLLRVEPKTGAFPWIEQLVGVNPNEPRTITYTYPENSGNAGKVATYTVTVTDIKEPQMPNLDDEFAKSIGAFENLEQLRGRIRANLLQQKQSEEDNRFEEQVIDAVIAQSQIDMPDTMVEDETSLEVSRMKEAAQRIGLTWEKYLQLGGKDEQTVRQDARPRAEKRVKRLLMLMELAEAEKIAVTAKDVDVEIDRRAMLAEQQGGRAAQTRRELSTPDARQNIEFGIKLGKTIMHMVALAKGEPTSGKILTPEMVQRAEQRAREQAAAQAAAAQAAAVSPSGLITDPSQVRAQDWPHGLDKPLIPGQNQ